MQTNFTAAQLADPDTRESERILRACVHCGFCTATCPTYVAARRRARQPARAHLPDQGHARERPAADARTSSSTSTAACRCLSCMTTCPSGVNYMHLVDHARHRIEATYRAARGSSARCAALLGDAAAASAAVSRCAAGGRLAAPFAGLLPEPAAAPRWPRARKAAEASPVDRPQIVRRRGPADAARRAAQRLRPAGAGARDQRGDDPAPRPPRLRGRRRAGAGCCGALAHHLGQDARAFARANILAWSREIERGRARRDRGQRLRLRHDGQGLRLHVPRRSRACGAGGRGLRARARRDGADRRDRPPAASQPQAGASPTTAPARCSTDSAFATRRRRCCEPAGFVVLEPPEGHCAAARPGPTTSCSRSSRPSCATARSPTSKASRRTWSRPATSAA